MVVSRVMSETPTCFFLNPSFQSAYVPTASYARTWAIEQLRTFATLEAPAFLGAGVTFFPAFLEIAWTIHEQDVSDVGK
jgi:hypothetical protein